MSSSSKTKTTVAPPSWAQGTIQNALGSEQKAYNQGSGEWNQFLPQVNQAIQNTADAADNPAPFITAARQNLTNTINGQYLTPNSNPFARAMGQQIADQTQAGYNGTFGAAGRSHGGLAALLSSQGVGNALDNFYGNIYQQERGLQQQATLAEPAFNADQYTGANNLLSEAQAASMTPEQLAALFGQSVATTVGPYGTTTQKTTQPFGLASILGLGLTGASMIPGVGNALGLGGGLAGLMGGTPAPTPNIGGGLAGLGFTPSPTMFGPLPSWAQANPYGGI